MIVPTWLIALERIRFENLYCCWGTGIKIGARSVKNQRVPDFREIAPPPSGLTATRGGMVKSRDDNNPAYLVVLIFSLLIRF